MSKLSEIISQRRASGQSRTGSFFGSLKDKIKEKIDPRQILNQTGILTALFPSLKAYKATTGSERVSGSGAPSWLDVKTKNVEVERIEKNTEIFAKNSMYFSEIARDINVSRINVGKLIKLVSSSAAEKADMYYKKTSEMEKSYESKFKSESKKSTRVDNKSKKSSFSWIKMIGLIGTVGVSYLLLDFIKNKEKSIVKEIYDELDEKFDSFKNNFLDFKEENFTNLYTEITELFSDKKSIPLFSELEKQTDNNIESFSKDFSLASIKDYILDGTGPLKKYETGISDFKGKLAEAATNVFPAAAASTMPSITSKPDSSTGTSSLGRSAPTTPTATGRTYNGELGSLSAKYESGKDGSMAVGRDKSGGTSYGKYQIASKVGSMDLFLKLLQKNDPEAHARLIAAGPQDAGVNGRFAQEWKKLVSEGRIQKSEREFAMDKIFKPAMAGLKDQDLSRLIDSNKGLQEMVFSMSIQHGPAGAPAILNKVYRKGMTPQQLTNAAYTERAADGGMRYFSNSTKDERASVVNRFERERQDVLNTISLMPTSGTSTSSIMDNLSRGVVANDMRKKSQVLIINRPYTVMASAPIGAPIGDQSNKKNDNGLNALMQSQYS
jgi:hypothetical protein